MVVSCTHVVWSVWYMNSTRSQSQMITQLGLLIECISLDPVGVRHFQQIPKLMTSFICKWSLQFVSRPVRSFTSKNFKDVVENICLPGNQDNCSMSKNNSFLLLNIVKVLSSTVMFWCTTALMHYSSELFSSHFRCTMSWNIDAEVVVSTYLMGGDSAHSDQDGSLWLNPVLMHSSCSLDLSSFKPRGYPCRGVMGCSVLPSSKPRFKL